MPREEWDALVRGEGCSVCPRYHDDPVPHRPTDPSAGQVVLTPDEYTKRVDLIRSALR